MWITVQTYLFANERGQIPEFLGHFTGKGDLSPLLKC